MLAWDRPQYSVHWPMYSPEWSAWMVSGWVRPGTASFLPFNAGAHQLWITSRDLMRSATWRPAGMTRSLAVMMSSYLPSLFVS